MDISDLHFLGESIPAGGGELRFNCPLCEEHGKSPDDKHHLYVNPKRGVYFCQRHGEGGTLESLFKHFDEEMAGPSMQSVEAIFDAFLLGAAAPEKTRCPHPDYFPVLSTQARAYLHDRGIDDEDIEYYDIREGDNEMAGRVIVPEYLDGNLVSWVGRAFWDIEPKYRNAPGETRRGAVFNLERVTTDHVIITEGVFDAIAAGRDAIALYGKYCSPIQIGRIAKKRFKRFFVSLDPDAATDAKKLCKLLWSWCGEDIWYVKMPEGEDPNSLGREAFRKLLDKARRYHPDALGLWM